ncbi:hypothetical protein SAMN02745121_02049 [Nannocystis exedens]|uniref:Lipoprotein n=1 Tax=Nannocystis exedens TaxID=54 RepID=A0A1I1VX64_9BACT|nr:hypothetical protein [Nannocystis exedens]PCC72931.1 hypothetical protein NAEX_06017 [Nannocystis exedens]SFD87572.1 hypothetical protein SAMN02745121_02049 [Nannocystis exedens]
MLRKILLATALASLPSAGCDSQACTLIGCGSTFQIALQRAAWTAGEYTVTVVADGETIECAATLPLQCDAPPACPQSSQLILGLEGCALDPSQHKLGNLEFQQGRAPKSVAVQVLQDGALLGEGQYSPNYSESQPNGPDCEPTCVGADGVTLTLK